MIDQNADKIKLNWTKRYDDGSTTLHHFLVRPCEVYQIEQKDNPKEGGIKSRECASSFFTIRSVEALKARTWDF